MKLSNSFFYTLREDVKDEESVSGNLLVRSGMIKKSSNGIYMYMPLGFKVLKNIEAIVREEMNKAGSQELLMPSLIPEEVYVASGRRDNFGSNMFSLKDRYNRAYVLGPTHEELFVEAARMKIKSYKDMPFNIYQIGTKYRDETRPRYGLIRVREFSMKDAYSFDVDEDSLDKSYQIMFDAYKKIFDRLGLNYKIVKADTGAMGGSLSEEFQAVTEIGEDILVLCNNCNYASNLEVSECVLNNRETKEMPLPKELVYTPHAGTIKEVSDYLGESEDKFVKTLIYKADGNFYAVMVRGDRDVNESKLAKVLQAKEVGLADLSDVERITKAKVGFAGPIDIEIPVVMDQDIKVLHNFIVGANTTNYHFKNVNPNDFEVSYIADIKNVKEGDLCPHCGKPLVFKKGIEVGNTFKLGDKYSKSLNLQYLDKNNKLQYVQMGCYGIGIGRIMASLAEQYADELGIAWPSIIAPFKVAIIIINPKDIDAKNLANEIYNNLMELNIDTVLDDRDERAGVKFNDMDLIGAPVRITVGRKATEGIVEFKLRGASVTKEYNKDEIIEKVTEILL